MAGNDKLIKEFEEMRECLHDTFNVAVPNLISKLKTFANELDETYKGTNTNFGIENWKYNMYQLFLLDNERIHEQILK